MQFKPFYTNKDINNIPISAGQMTFATDTKSIYLDLNETERIKMSKGIWEEIPFTGLLNSIYSIAYSYYNNPSEILYVNSTVEENIEDMKNGTWFKAEVRNLYNTNNFMKYDDAATIGFYNTNKIEDFSNFFTTPRSFGRRSLLNILAITELNTINATNMCNFLTYISACLDLDEETKVIQNENFLPLSFNTSKVKDMSYMFASSSLLFYNKPLNINTSKVVNMSHMFQNYGAMANINWDTGDILNDTLIIDNNFNTSKVTNMANMFANIQDADVYGLNNINTISAKDTSYMFADFRADSNDNWLCFNLNNLTNGENMFYQAYGITINGRYFIEHLPPFNQIINPTNNLLEYFGLDSSGYDIYFEDEEPLLSYYQKGWGFNDATRFRNSARAFWNNIIFEAVNVSNNETLYNYIENKFYYYDRRNFYNNVFIAGIQFYNNGDLSHAFENMHVFPNNTTNTNDYLIISQLANAATVKNMSYMFNNSYLHKILHKFDMSGLTNGENMFLGCYNLTTESIANLINWMPNYSQLENTTTSDFASYYGFSEYQKSRMTSDMNNAIINKGYFISTANVPNANMTLNLSVVENFFSYYNNSEYNWDSFRAEIYPNTDPYYGRIKQNLSMTPQEYTFNNLYYGLNYRIDIWAESSTQNIAMQINIANVSNLNENTNILARGWGA